MSRSCGCELTSHASDWFRHNISPILTRVVGRRSRPLDRTRTIILGAAAAENNEILEQQPELRMFKCFSAACLPISFPNRTLSDGPRLRPYVFQNEVVNKEIRRDICCCYIVVIYPFDFMGCSIRSHYQSRRRRCE